MTPCTTQAETDRIEALNSYDILDTIAEQSYDDFTLLASYICDTPIALISLVDTSRQWFKSKVGLDLEETARDISFCTHAIHQADVMMIPDAEADERFADSPLVTGQPGIRFYAGAPLVTPEGHGVGTLCVIDRVPRRLTEKQRTILKALSRQIVAQLELRKALATIKTLRGLLPICSYCKKIRNDEGYWNSVESYISAHSDARLTHGICPDCYEEVQKACTGRGENPVHRRTKPS
jgi:GAF domain-containing protein